MLTQSRATTDCTKFSFFFSGIVEIMLKDIKEPVFNRPTRGFVDGCFDLMHSGHFNAIRQAKGMLGKILTVHGIKACAKH